MFFIAPAIFIIVVIVVLIAVQKKSSGPARLAAGVIIVIVGTACLCAVSFFGFLKMLFMGGFLESKGATPAEQAMIVTGFTLLMLLSSAIVVFGLSLFTNIMKYKMMIVAIALSGLIFPAFTGFVAWIDSVTANINLKGVVQYFTSKKFTYGRLHWNMDKVQAMSITREGYSSPPEETCGVSGRIFFMRYNDKNKLYQIELMFNTKTKKEQDYLVSCLTSKYGVPASSRKGVQCGCSIVRWQLPETKIEMTLYDEEMNGAVTTPAYSMVVIQYTFWPQYLKLKEAAAWGGM